MPLFQINRITPHKTSFPVTFALFDRESIEIYTWISRQLRALGDELGIDFGTNWHVVMTDDYNKLKPALSQVFPEVQQ